MRDNPNQAIDDLAARAAGDPALEDQLYRECELFIDTMIIRKVRITGDDEVELKSWASMAFVSAVRNYSPDKAPFLAHLGVALKAAFVESHRERFGKAGRPRYYGERSTVSHEALNAISGAADGHYESFAAQIPDHRAPDPTDIESGAASVRSLCLHARLTPLMTEVITSTYGRGISPPEVAEVLGLSESRIYQLSAEARRRLAEYAEFCGRDHILKVLGEI